MFVALLLFFLPSQTVYGADLTLGPHLEWWHSAARHPMGAGLTLRIHQPVVKTWGIELETAYARGVEKGPGLTYQHNFFRAAGLWTWGMGKETISVRLGLGPSVLLRENVLVSDANPEPVRTRMVLPGVRLRGGLDGAVFERVAWSWHMGLTSVSWPGVHFDTGATMGVRW